jgi:beta-aspartyl-peptidase (threonine type)
MTNRNNGSADDFSLMVHGGAGALNNTDDPKAAAAYRDSLGKVLENGRAILAAGGAALEAVEACAMMLEDDPEFNAGRGSVLNESGKVEMDAAIMDGRDLSAGAVAAVDNIANPIALARRVMSDSEHVMLVGDGALRFADHCGIERATEDYFYTPDRIEQLHKARKLHKVMLDHDETDEDSEDQKYGTIGAIARDRQGDLAAATSTGGIVNKRLGRVGDSPIIGAGVYADNATCAVSATGFGEDFMRVVIAKTVADFIDMQGLDAAQATRAAIDYLVRKVKGRGGVIVIDRTGRCASGFTTRKMLHGWIEKGGETVCRI